MFKIFSAAGKAARKRPLRLLKRALQPEWRMWERAYFYRAVSLSRCLVRAATIPEISPSAHH